MKYRILFETRCVKEIVVDADSYELAATAAAQMDVKAEPKSLRPTWIGEDDTIAATGEYEFDIIGKCTRCEKSIVNRDIPGQRYTYDPDPEMKDGSLACYPCLNKTHEI